MTKKAHRTYHDHFLERGKELARTIGNRVGEGGSYYYSREIEVNPYVKPEFGHLLQHDELVSLWTYIVWSTLPRHRGPRDLLPSEKLRRMRADHDEFEREKTKFEAAKEKAPRKKAIEVLMKKWNVNDESTVEKRIAKWGKTPEGIGEATVARAKAFFLGQRRKTQKAPKMKKDMDDDVPF